MTAVAAQAAAAVAPAQQISIIDLISGKGWCTNDTPGASACYSSFRIFRTAHFIYEEASKIEENFMNIIRDNIISGKCNCSAVYGQNTNNPCSQDYR